MSTREQVLELLKSGHSYQTAARELGEPVGRVYMIATGLPADGSQAPAAEARADKPVQDRGSHELVEPPPFNAARRQQLLDWVRERAARDLAQPR